MKGEDPDVFLGLLSPRAAARVAPPRPRVLVTPLPHAGPRSQRGLVPHPALVPSPRDSYFSRCFGPVWACTATRRRCVAQRPRDAATPVKEGFKLYFEGTDTLAGRWVSRVSDAIRSNLLVDSAYACVRSFSRFTGCSLGEAIKCVTFNPMRCLGVENRKGTLRPGADADLVILNRSGNVLSTWVRGKEVWQKE